MITNLTPGPDTVLKPPFHDTVDQEEELIPVRTSLG